MAEIDPLLYTSTATASALMSHGNRAQFEDAARRAHDDAMTAMNSMMRGTPIQIMYEAAIRVLNLTPGLLALLGVGSAATQVLYARSGDHTRVRHPEHVPDIYHELPISPLVYVGARRSDGVNFELVYSTPTERMIFMGIKFVPANQPANKSGVDQCWASTLGFRRLKDIDVLLRRQLIRPVTDQERSDVGAIHSGPI